MAEQNAKDRVIAIGDSDSIFNQILYEIRDEKIQAERGRFRKNIARASTILAYEISKKLRYVQREVTTPLGTLEMRIPSDFPIIVSILRAGIPMHQGFLDVFDQADNGFISAYRQHSSAVEFVIQVEYSAIPTTGGRDLILLDPMIATGQSIVSCFETIESTRGRPDNIFIAGIIGAEQGIEYVQKHIPDANIIVGAIDKELTTRAYIVPGLGDAGDLAFGPKD